MSCGINVRNRYATLSDNDLDTMVSSCTEQNRMIGCNSILAQLWASGVWVQRHRIRASLKQSRSNRRCLKMDYISSAKKVLSPCSQFVVAH